MLTYSQTITRVKPGECETICSLTDILKKAYFVFGAWQDISGINFSIRTYTAFADKRSLLFTSVHSVPVETRNLKHEHTE